MPCHMELSTTQCRYSAREGSITPVGRATLATSGGTRWHGSATYSALRPQGGFFLLPLNSLESAKFTWWGGLAPVTVGITRLTWQLGCGGPPCWPVPAQRSQGMQRGARSDLVKFLFSIVSPPLRDKAEEGFCRLSCKLNIPLLWRGRSGALSQAKG
jgi:hypothetical protein